MLIKLCLPSSGSILPWSIVLVLLFLLLPGGTEQGIPRTQGTWKVLSEQMHLAFVRGNSKGALRKAPSSAAIVVFVPNGIMIGIWISLENFGTEICGCCDVSRTYLPSPSDQCLLVS